MKLPHDFQAAYTNPRLKTFVDNIEASEFGKVDTPRRLKAAARKVMENIHGLDYYSLILDVSAFVERKRIIAAIQADEAARRRMD